MQFTVNKVTTQVAALALALVTLIAGAVICNPVVETTVTEIDLTALSSCRTAGIISTVSTLEATVAEEVQVANLEVDFVAATIEEVVPEEDINPEWADSLMADVKDYLYVRSEPSKEGAVMGKLRKGDKAEIISEADGWYEIESGDLTGFVSAEYCVIGDDAYELATEVCATYATTTVGGLRIRSEASQDGSVLKSVGQGTKLIVDLEADEVDGWVAVKSGATEGYVSADYVEVALATGEGLTKEKEAELKAKAAEAKAKQVAPPETVQNNAMAASADDLVILAAIIQIEAGGEAYEGKVAVGAVVMNRVRSGHYPNSVYNVVFAPGQFATGKMAGIIANGPKASCMQAAADAIAGVDNTGGSTHFRRANSGHPGYVIGNHVFY